ncbi:MAG TPA: acetate kinase [Acidobacteriota bacterium]|jgi:acetate kinase|nr:acetate kinase [Acidobacteriota bacterium]HPB26627.1 acetate kinase [Acidobacteriota bacterium]HQO24086.1 acetate kinase [Acidobacteriota bacterium]HQP72844.1 acetate kinase [Acidobacteriota bacterium]
MIVLTLNCGSSTVKYKLINTATQKNLAVGKADRVGMMGAIIDVERPGGEKIVRETELLDHAMAISAIIRLLVEPELGILKSLDEIQAIGHRVVHGGETFTGSVRITDAVVQTLKDNIQLAPLHNPPNIVGIEAAMAILPNVPMVGVFDTAFHTTMPEHAYIYPIPYALYKKYAIRRYGFHGTSHFYVARRACEILKTKASDTNLITLHLGNGASATAVQGGKSVDTTMGFTPLEGLVMGTRCGDIDPAIIIHIMDQEKISVREANNLLNKFSGLIGISGQSSDMRDLEDLYQKGDKQARLAIDIYAYRIKKYIGAYAAALGQLDCIVFTAGIGENSPLIREKSIEGLDRLGIKLDKKRNDGLRAKEAVISADDSPVKVLVVPTNEELVIAMDTAEIVSGKKSS